MTILVGKISFLIKILIILKTYYFEKPYIFAKWGETIMTSSRVVHILYYFRSATIPPLYLCFNWHTFTVPHFSGNLLLRQTFLLPSSHTAKPIQLLSSSSYCLSIHTHLNYVNPLQNITVDRGDEGLNNLTTFQVNEWLFIY